MSPVTDRAERYPERVDYMKTELHSAHKLAAEIDIGLESLEAQWYAAYTRSRHEKRFRPHCSSRPFASASAPGRYKAARTRQQT